MKHFSFFILFLTAFCRSNLIFSQSVIKNDSVYQIGKISMYPFFGNDLSNRRQKWIEVNDTILIDTLSLISGSVIIEKRNGEIINFMNFTIDAAKSLLTWKFKPVDDSLKFFYRIYPYNFSSSYYHKDQSKIEKAGLDFRPYIYSPNEGQKSIFDFGTLNYNGSISRGISFGNNQDLILNSSLNLQMSGNITDDIEVKAAITDENIPLQPEGNTQQLQEFDKVFIQFKKGQSTLIAGDYEITRPESHFMNFYKKAQGGSFHSVYSPDKKSKMKSGISLAVAKGKYNKQLIIGEEGNQGPYKLYGNNGETFIIVLSGTERIFIDGLQLERGADRDYIIDYNSGEMTFTPKRLITKDSRIVAEFEYSDKNYFRSLLYLNQEYEKNKVKLKFNYYLEQDNKNQPVQQNIGSLERKVLNEIGDSINQAFISGIRNSKMEDSSRVLYRKVDTFYFVAGVRHDTVAFVYTLSTDSVKYTVVFSEIGQGNGDYRISSAAINGRVYEWIAPDSLTGIKQGNYAPLIRLIPPKKQQMYTLGLDYKINKSNFLKTEISISNYDVNTFSKKGNKDNNGEALMLSYQNIIQFRKDHPDDLTLVSDVNYEFLGETYNPIERNRTVEFERDWNLATSSKKTEEHNGNVAFTLSKNKLGNIGYGLAVLQKVNDFEGYQHNVNSLLERGGFRVLLTGSYLETQSQISNTKFLRPRADVSKSFSKLRGWRLGVKGEQENNKFFDLNSDTMTIASYKYDLYQVYIKNPDTATVKINADYTQRWDYKAFHNAFNKTTLGNIYNFGGSINKNPNNQLLWNITYRELKILDPQLTNQKAEDALLGRMEYGFTLWQGFLHSYSLYEIGSGREQKRSYQFSLVPKGIGTHIYLGNDKDSMGNQLPVSQLEISQFVIASFQNEANYIKVFNLTNEYIKTYSTQFNQTLDLIPKALWFQSQGVKKIISHFSTQSALQIGRKILNTSVVFPFNPFEMNVDDSVLVSLNSNIRNSIYFNRTGSMYGMELNWQDTRDKIVLNTGSDSRQNKSKDVKTRLNWNRNFSNNLAYSWGQKINTSGYAKTNDFEVVYFEIEPKINYQIGSIFRVSLFYDYSESKNIQPIENEKGIGNKITLESKYNILSKSTLNGKVSYVNFKYDYPSNTPVSFAILQGLQPGKNILWSLAYDRTVSNGIQMSFIYDGRQSGNNKIIHSGKVQVRALF